MGRLARVSEVLAEGGFQMSAGNSGKMIFIGEKESFIVRVLMKKVQDSGVDTSFVHWSVDEINKSLEDVSLIAMFIEEGERPKESVLHFLTDIMEDKSLQMVIVGDRIDLQHLYDHIPGDMIYKTFIRPVDNAEFTKTISEYLSKMASGEFRKSILVVDDDPQYLGMLREWLKGTYRVSMANSGLQAIKWLGKNKVDLILLDYEMPVTTGPQVLEMLRSDEETKSIPVMFLTGKGDKKSVMAVVELKPEGYFLKGIEKDELLKNLQDYFTLH